MTNNIAEYSGILELLHALIRREYFQQSISILICGDSQLVIKQMSGEWQARQGKYIFLYEQAMQCMELFDDNQIHFKWIPRAENSAADELTNTAYRGYCKEHNMQPCYMEKKKRNND